MPRTFGYCFNPLSIYFCRDRDGALVALIYQVHNTFGERHSYVLPLQRRSGAVHQSCGKNFYVSPFMDMALRYDFRVSGPDEHIAVGIAASASDGPVLNAVLGGSRRALDDRALLKLCVTMPAITLKVIAAIHWEALRLWLKGLRPRHHPATEEAMNSALSTPRLGLYECPHGDNIVQLKVSKRRPLADRASLTWQRGSVASPR